jgi:Kef-type K+ transport system membrane component KefB
MNENIFLHIALILLFTKVFGIFFKKIGFPEVAGALLAGLVLGPSMLGIVEGSDIIKLLAQIGVVMIMFTAGMETNLKQIKSVGVASVAITLGGVIVPLGLGFVAACLFNGGFGAPPDVLLSNLYYGIILTATSVSITIATLKELGKLSGKIGAAITSAAVLDDVIGLVALSFVISLKDVSVNSLSVLLYTLLFFVFAVVAGIIIHFVFKFLENKYPHNRRMSIFSLAFCLLFAFLAEHIFHTTDIIGAFVAGMVLSTIKSAKYIERRIDISAYMMFAPMFFASIGINNTFGAFDISVMWFGIVFVIAGLLSKIIGCGLGAKICRFNVRQSLFIGIGMMPRAEVMLISVQLGIVNGFINTSFLPYALILVLVSSILAPILLKVTNDKEEFKPLMGNTPTGHESEWTID